MEQLANSIQGISFEQLAQNIITVDDSMRGLAVKTINQATTLRNWIIGCYIVEYEQNGSDRTRYGDKLIEKLSKRISKPGLGTTLLRKSRTFYMVYPSVIQVHSIQQMLSVELKEQIRQTLSVISVPSYGKHIDNVRSSDFYTPAETLVSKLTFSHIVELLSIKDPLVRFFYEMECIRGTWSVRELHRRIVEG